MLHLLLVNLLYVRLELWTAFFDVYRPATFVFTVLISLKDNFFEKSLSFWEALRKPPILGVRLLLIDCVLQLQFVFFVHQFACFLLSHRYAMLG